MTPATTTTGPIAPSGVAMPGSVAELPTKEDGSIAHGELVAVPLMPAKGPIDVAAGTPVGLVVQRFWDSPTVKATRNVVVWCGGFSVAVFFAKVTGVGGNVLALDWRSTGTAMLAAFTAALGAVFSGWWMKRKDNNPVQ